MNIILLGYGRMGKEIEKVALERNHKIIGKITSKNQDELTAGLLSKADAVIEFTIPEAASANVKRCLEASVPVVVGTTGWHGDLEKLTELCNQQKGSLLHASNFSVGVNILFHINKLLAKVMGRYPQYEPQIREVHHTNKLDAPSGTAITLADDICEAFKNKKVWRGLMQGDQSEQVAGSFDVISERTGDVKGIHEVKYECEIDSIQLRHEAFNRSGFAYGAVFAAEWIQDKRGVFTMKDVLELN
jgi:4-hydroxy-tetrahydrodipicolinate reductase